jgi:CheY-like chemotaxis protein
MKVLVVEDEDPKLDAILRLLRSLDCDVSIDVARSVKSGLAALKANMPDILLLDMSLPTFDISGSEPGGRPQGFGGIEIVRYVDSIGSELPVVVLSAYEAFSKDGKNIQLKTLGSELARDYPALIRGVVYFDPTRGNWSEDLTRLVSGTIRRMRGL